MEKYEYELMYETKLPIEVTDGAIVFNAFDTYKQQALAIAEYVYNTEVTEENVKECKKVIAEARRVVNKLEDERKRIKREWMAPYTTFEKQMKEVVSIIDDADKEVRSQVRDLEEKEREKKKVMLREMFNRKAQWMIIFDAIDDLFDRWLTPYYLNKTVSVKQCEEAMAEWLNQKESEFDTLMGTEDEELRADYLTAYCRTLDLNTAIKSVQDDRKVNERIQSINTGVVDEEKGIFIVSGKANIKLVEMLLDENGIKYQLKKEK